MNSTVFADIKPLIDFEDDDVDVTSVNAGKLVTDWTVDDVSNWLVSMKLSDYRDKFRKNKIDGQELLHLNEAMLKNSLNIGMKLVSNFA